MRILQRNVNGNNYIEKFAKENQLYNFLKTQLNLDDSKISELFINLKIKKSFFELKSLEDLLEASLVNNPNYSKNTAFVCLIERVLLLNHKAKLVALKCYSQIIKENSYQNVEFVLEHLVNSFNENVECESLPLLLECIHDALNVRYVGF